MIWYYLINHDPCFFFSRFLPLPTLILPLIVYWFVKCNFLRELLSLDLTFLIIRSWFELLEMREHSLSNQKRHKIRNFFKYNQCGCNPICLNMCLNYKRCINHISTIPRRDYFDRIYISEPGILMGQDYIVSLLMESKLATFWILPFYNSGSESWKT